MTHTHPCQQCSTPVDCDGDWERNDDGFPEMVCPEFHRQDGSTSPDFVCPACRREQDDRYVDDLRRNL